MAEDDRAVREALVMALELEGYDVRATTNGEQALAEFDGFDPAVVVLDVMMPTVDGLHGVPPPAPSVRRARPPILMLTAVCDQVADRVSGLDAGADDYVVKPLSPDELLARLRALLPEPGRRRPTPPPLVVADLAPPPLRPPS